MSLPEPYANASKLELHKALIQMRLELHRQELRHETLLALKPLQAARNMGQQWRSVLGSGSAPIWGATALGVLALVLVRRKPLNQWLSLGSAIAPLLVQLLRRSSAETNSKPTASSETPNDGA
ncbi:MAG: hypothetical protein Q8R10_01510 [Pseudomonas sp.]|uniref:hypothetical protein n=1 Tax=Pseudomonas sp. TaxID=306 RepID=UPI0027362113|nr:hypothetical protein [Pseudomonas sp.]MDP3845091.1 hypothetical protein [Pseudomonas sp.]